jgi:hypothetical protein
VRRPTCPAELQDPDHPDVQATCIRPRWHRGMHHSAFLPLPDGDTVALTWIRDWRTPLIRVLDGVERWTTRPTIEPIDWGKR